MFCGLLLAIANFIKGGVMQKLTAIFVMSIIISALCFTITEAAKMEYDNPRVPVNVSAGEEFVIKLATNQTVGFKWTLAEGTHENIVEFVSSNYQHNPLRVLGGGAFDYWTFKAVGAGTATLKFNYVQSAGDQSALPADTKTFTVNVQ